MCRLLIVGGTTEGRQLAQFCADHRISAWVSVASQYGCDLLPSSEYLHILVNRMDWQEMAEFMRDKQVRLVVDATHPYAKEVTGNIKRACMEEQRLRAQRRKGCTMYPQQRRRYRCWSVRRAMYL